MSAASPSPATTGASWPALIIGAGPAGLATAGCLKQRGIGALVLEAGPALGVSWRNHYDRLHLHTVKEQSHLPGLPFGDELPRYVSRADFVAYLEAYAARFEIVPRTGEAVRRVASAGDGSFVVESAGGVHRARAVVVAAGFSRSPNPERLPQQEMFRGALLHSAAYRNGAPFAGQRVLVVGAGNTGAEIALDLVEHGAAPTLAVRAPINVVPRDFLGMPIQLTTIRLQRAPLKLADGVGRLAAWLAFGNLARLGFPRAAMGPVSSIVKRRRIPLIDVGTIAAVKRGRIAVKPGVARLTEAGAVFADESAADFDAVVLATGFRPALEDFLGVPGVLGEDGVPRGWRGGGACPNLFFVGYEIVASGHLRQIALRAEAVAAALARLGAK
ncbi:MAG TPA: NAD(P)/FAD-dependent oxidoreductase [Polyangia bacterium]|nr:NAD(P)/FAD-dependent oxidoreductase [Polyangia bacterium]